MSVVAIVRYFNSLRQPGCDDDNNETIEELGPGVPYDPDCEETVRFRFVHIRYKSTRIAAHLFGVEDVRIPMQFYSTERPLPSLQGIFYLQTANEVFGPFDETPTDSMVPAGWYRVFQLISGFENHVTKVCFQIGVVKF